MTRFTPSRRQKDTAARHDNGDSFATCGVCGKRTFHSKRAARAALRKLTTHNGRHGITPISDGAVMRPYRACGVAGFHLGHRTNRGRPNLNDPRLNFVEPARGLAPDLVLTDDVAPELPGEATA